MNERKPILAVVSGGPRDGEMVALPDGRHYLALLRPIDLAMLPPEGPFRAPQFQEDHYALERLHVCGQYVPVLRTMDGHLSPTVCAFVDTLAQLPEDLRTFGLARSLTIQQDHTLYRLIEVGTQAAHAGNRALLHYTRGNLYMSRLLNLTP